MLCLIVLFSSLNLFKKGKSDFIFKNKNIKIDLNMHDEICLHTSVFCQHYNSISMFMIGVIVKYLGLMYKNIHVIVVKVQKYPCDFLGKVTIIFQNRAKSTHNILKEGHKYPLLIGTFAPTLKCYGYFCSKIITWIILHLSHLSHEYF